MATKGKQATWSQKLSDEEVLWHVFSFKECFEYKELTERASSINIGESHISITESGLEKDGIPWAGQEEESLVAIPHEQIQIHSFTYPKLDLLFSKEKKADVCLESQALLYLKVKENTYHLSGSSNGAKVYLNGQILEEVDASIQVGDVLVVDCFLFSFREHQIHFLPLSGQYTIQSDHLFEEPYQAEFPHEFPNYRRSPRIYLKEPEDKVEINSPAPEEKLRRGELWRAIVPPVGMVVISGASSVFMQGNALLMMGMASASLLTAGFSVSSYFTNKKEVKEKNQKRNDDYQEYLLETGSQLSRLKAEQKKALTYNFPSVDELVDLVESYNPRIYEKMVTNDDFLKVHLGTGAIDSSYSLRFQPTNRKEDWSRFVEKKLVQPHIKLEDAPIVLSLRDQALGLAGAAPVLRVAVQTLLFQIAALHSYHDVEFVTLVSQEEYENHWREWRWLPHAQMRSLNLRGLIHDDQTRDMVLTSFYQMLVKRRQVVREQKQEQIFSPHYVLTILDESWLSGHGLNEFLAEDMTQYGVTVIWGKESLNMLPETVTAVVDYQNGETAKLVNNHHIYVNQDFKPNRLPQNGKLEEAIYRLANLNHIEVEKNSIPDTISFMELYGVKQVEELDVEKRWQAADASKSLAVPLGVRGKDDIVLLNLHERAHGPHGLVAGTTGSGKSEIVQSYILSLAVNFTPEDVGFLPIDFKGGGMANLFAKLPHLMGAITNLDGAGTARALKSIRAELQKRQRLFGKFGVNHINGYTKLYKKGRALSDPEEKKTYPTEPLPHLFLISDEFAELKQNEPEFMAELVSTARIGRSLGVHLILATQKPSGVVDEQIWSNSRFKLALKVADPSDSNEIIKTPDAASITQPGRAYLQVGNNEIYELFQSAWSGADYQPYSDEGNQVDERIWLVNQLGQSELLIDGNDGDYSVEETQEQETELEAVIDYINKETERLQVILPEKPWLPPLGEELVGVAIDHQAEWTTPRQLSIPLGMLDLPSAQKQEVYHFDIEELGNTVLYGSPGFGKSTALQTILMNLARRNTPEQVQFNLFDFGTNGLLPIRGLPHVADLVRLDEEEKLLKYLKRLDSLMKERKALFTEVGVSSLSQYEQKTGQALPVLLNIFDGYDSVRESPLEEIIESAVNQLLREGASLGIYTLITVLSASSLRLRMSSTIPNALCFYLVEEGALRTVMGRDALPGQEIVGRAQVTQEEVLELQVYLPIEGKDDIDRLSHLTAEIQSMNQDWQGLRPEAVPMLPSKISTSFFEDHEEVQDMWQRGELPIGFDKESTHPVGFVPKRDGYFELLYDTMQQLEYGEAALLTGLEKVPSHIKKFLVDPTGNYHQSEGLFDEVFVGEEIPGFFMDMQSEVDARTPADLDYPIYILIPEAQALSKLMNLKMTEDAFKALLHKGGTVGLHFIFMGELRQIVNGYMEVDKILKVNVPAGCIGIRFQDQNVVSIKSSFTESVVGVDEYNYFTSREGYRIKLISE